MRSARVCSCCFVVCCARKTVSAPWRRFSCSLKIIMAKDRATREKHRDIITATCLLERSAPWLTSAKGKGLSWVGGRGILQGAGLFCSSRVAGAPLPVTLWGGDLSYWKCPLRGKPGATFRPACGFWGGLLRVRMCVVHPHCYTHIAELLETHVCDIPSSVLSATTNS